MLCQAVVGRALDFDVYGVAGIVGRERGSSVKVRDLGRLRMVKKATNVIAKEKGEIYCDCINKQSANVYLERNKEASK